MAAIVLLSSAVMAQEQEVKPNELRTGWGVMYGYARRVASAGKQAGIWLSYDAFSADIGIFEKDVVEGQWALASIRTEPPKGRGFFFEAGAGWGRMPEEFGFPVQVTVTDGVGWQAALGYRFSPAFRVDLKALGIEGESFAPWLTIAFNF
jgi:hypothetical protein